MSIPHPTPRCFVVRHAGVYLTKVSSKCSGEEKGRGAYPYIIAYTAFSQKLIMHENPMFCPSVRTWVNNPAKSAHIQPVITSAP